MSVRRRTFFRNLVAMPREATVRKMRVITSRDQIHSIGGAQVVLPPDSRLPYYQWRDPTYDSYAAPLLGRACEDATGPVLIDIGGNVGDTAVMALTSSPNLRVVTVEGSDYFLDYLRRNVAPYHDRVEVVDGFVGPVAGLRRYRRDGGTGGFQPRSTPTKDSLEVAAWTSVPDLLARHGEDLSIWKCDTDGFDIHIVAEWWDEISTQCEVIWMEFDPVGTLGPSDDVEALIESISLSGREIHVYDNVGHHMCSAVGPSGGRVLAELTGWLRERRRGFAPVLYFDVWIATERMATKMWPRS